MKLIVACDPNGGIGYKNKLPWSKIEGDLPRFKTLTENKVVIMGRKTWDSLPIKPLPNRSNFVVTTDAYSLPWTANKERIFAITELRALKSFNEQACVIGGAKIIELTWEYIHEIHLTRVLTEYTCDTFIDLIKLKKDFICASIEEHADHNYEIWKRK